jgi:hypothetical protein
LSEAVDNEDFSRLLDEYEAKNSVKDVGEAVRYVMRARKGRGNPNTVADMARERFSKGISL